MSRQPLRQHKSPAVDRPVGVQLGLWLVARGPKSGLCGRWAAARSRRAALPPPPPLARPSQIGRTASPPSATEAMFKCSCNISKQRVLSNNNEPPFSAAGQVCRECREERADGNLAGQQTDNAAEQGGGGRGGKGEAEGPTKCEHNPAFLKKQKLRGRQHLKHIRIKSACKDCGGTSICEYNRQGHRCKDYGGTSICDHNRKRSTFKDCGVTSEPASASTTARGANPRTAGAPASASITAAGAIARTANVTIRASSIQTRPEYFGSERRVRLLIMQNTPRAPNNPKLSEAG